MASHVYQALSKLYLMVWYNQEDLLTWSFQLQVIPLQERVLELEAREAERQRATSCPPVWVQLVDDPTKPSTATAFMVFPTVGIIDGLKKAVKAEKPSL